MSNLTPFGDRYAIDPVQTPNIVNGLIIPDMAKKIPNKGKVISCSKTMEKKDIKLEVNVMFSSYGAIKINFEGKDVFLVRHDDIWAIYLSDGLIIPLSDRYIIEPFIPPVIVNGIMIPENYQKPPTKGKIIAISYQMEKEGIAKDDIVTFSSYAATKIEYTSKVMMLVRHHDILVIH
jgi:co-chaperonin GroES (HSP10)